ncbi:MAG: hypothetical protein HC825_03740 [Oscillatoriales cyanobacterium RM1_1_9]|nr:hypothetical protein [Oscillatoriales cyanobacterium SM2_3_0]NJO44411.1 hypothetical protein [Oscillatoriales cyanobacterium RM2_1_1]NJO71044.1 hypothetical protein [Oscillatoriales cyanobacterium RM1_1_9]
MSDRFAEMDNWTSEQVAQFKESGRLKMYQTSERAVSLQANGPGILMAEGDSWFDYLPGTDIIDCLRQYYDYLIENYAQAGDTLENMIYGTRVNRDFEPVSPTIDRVLQRLGELQPPVFLFSGGGNDVAGESFESYLNHKDSGLPVLRESFLEDMINVVYRKYLEDLIAKVAAVAPNTHIITHGYGYTLPTGIGVSVLFVTFSGPWLKPALARKDILDPEEQRQIIFKIISKYNEMMMSLEQKYEKFHYLDLRLRIDPQQDWVDELHLRNSAYARVAEQIHTKIQALMG